MGKIIKPKKFRTQRGGSAGSSATASEQAAKEALREGGLTTEQLTGSERLSRGQRKREKRKAAFLKKVAFGHEALKLHNEEQKKQGVDGLGSLTSCLPSLEEAKSNNQKIKNAGIKTNKSKTRVAASEIKLLHQVHEHPAFQADPFAALQEHLQNTMSSK
jgi:hypothetical protein